MITNGHSIYLLEDLWISDLPPKVDTMIFDVSAIEPGSTIKHFIAHERKWDKTKIGLIFHLFL